MSKLLKAISYLESLGIKEPTGEQITAYERYALENLNNKDNKYSIVYNKIRFYKEIGLADRSKKLSEQLNHINQGRRYYYQYRSPEFTLKLLGRRILEEVCKSSSSESIYLAYLATGDNKRGEKYLVDLYWRPYNDWNYERYLSLREIKEILAHCYQTGALKLEEIVLKSPLKIFPEWKKSKEEYKLAKSFARAIETANYWENKGGEKNEIYRKQIRTLSPDSHKYWESISPPYTRPSPLTVGVHKYDPEKGFLPEFERPLRANKSTHLDSMKALKGGKT